MATDSLTVPLLSWVAERPRRYEDTTKAWRTTCPRLTIWEDAVSDRPLTNGRARWGVLLTERVWALLREGIRHAG
jgi:hypothetical protein